MKKTQLAFCSLALLTTACYPATPRPDYTIKVAQTAQGSVATPPTCPSWAKDNADPYDNQPEPQFGCSQARNLALEVENPDDLLHGRALADQRGVTAVGAVRRYDNNQTRGLITPDTETSQLAVTTAPTAASPMSGDVTGSAGSSSSSAGAAAASP